MTVRTAHPASIPALLLMAVLAAPLPALAQKSLGGGGGSGPVMTRDELRACLKQQATLATMVQNYEQERADLEREKGEILQNKQTLDAEAGGVKADVSKINELNARTEALSKRVSEWNENWQAFEKANRSGPMAERERRRLLSEKRSMEKEEKDLADERAALGDASGGASQVNSKVDALNARTVAWNERNKRVVKMGEDLTQERDLWASECGNRRYREDDEIAIRNGQ
ncbi:hypothetical protein [Rubrivivax albus]|uniref:Uncharacterized protein n=1 Tax=Rubrivivax albus TaxID=2499835 RepID=A0A437JUZ4_9BURK|nr:hypothetical protein [Rubrivivax albus]RVT51068.1 hypothetical protein ENE75_14910 [Rubrivivax albus]